MLPSGDRLWVSIQFTTDPSIRQWQSCHCLESHLRWNDPEFCVPSAGFISCLAWIKLSNGEKVTFVFRASDGSIHLYEWSKGYPHFAFCSVTVAHEGAIESLAWDSIHCCYARHTLVGWGGTWLSWGRYSRRDTVSSSQSEDTKSKVQRCEGLKPIAQGLKNTLNCIEQEWRLLYMQLATYTKERVSEELHETK